VKSEAAVEALRSSDFTEFCSLAFRRYVDDRRVFDAIGTALELFPSFVAAVRRVLEAHG
jgi:hypothetical protein